MEKIKDLDGLQASPEPKLHFTQNSKANLLVSYWSGARQMLVVCAKLRKNDDLLI